MCIEVKGVIYYVNTPRELFVSAQPRPRTAQCQWIRICPFLKQSTAGPCNQNNIYVFTTTATQPLQKELDEKIG